MGEPQAPLSVESQQLSEGIAAIVNSTGQAIFTFPSVPNGFTWTGTLNCSAAPISAQFLATIGATGWGNWAGDSVYGPIQAFGMQQLVVVATGLTPGTTVELAWLGSSDPSNLVAAVWPDPNTSSVEASIAGAGIVGSSAGIATATIIGVVAGSVAAFLNLPSPCQLWNWGWNQDSGTATAAPTSGSSILRVGANAGSGAGLDNLSWQEGSSARLAGIIFPTISGVTPVVTNHTAVTLDYFLTYSP